MAIEGVLLRLVAVIFLLETLADTMKPEVRNSDGSTLGGVERNDISMLHNGQHKNVLSDREKKSSKASISYSPFPLYKKENLKESRINEEFEKFPPLALRNDIPEQKSRSRRNFMGISSSNVTSNSGLNNDSVNLPSTAPSTPALFRTDITVTCEMDRLSCKNRCAKERDLGQTNDSYFPCYCDEYCEAFTDCCYDYRQRCKNDSGYGHSNESLLVGNMKCNISNNESTSGNYFKCISPPKGNGLSGTNGIWMIANCPNHFQNTPAQEKCIAESSLSYQNHNDNIPVIARDGKTYKNRFCSLCHGVSDDELSYYGLSFSCDIIPPRSYTSENTMRFLYSYCSISWKPNSGHQRRYCYSTIIKKCSRSASEILQKGCHDGPPGIVSSQKRNGYKNVYCAMCHSVTSLVCGPTATEIDCDVCGTKPFSVIMDLGFSGQSHPPNVPRQTQVSCSTGKVYDPHLELCRRGIASAPKQTGLDRYSVSVWIKNTTEPSQNVMATPQEQLFFLQTFISSLNTDNLSVSNTGITPDGKTYRIMFDFATKVEKTRNQRRVPTSIYVADLLEFSQPIDVLIKSKNFTIIKVTARRLTCVVVERFLPHEYTITAHPESAAYINRTKEVIKRQNYYQSDSKNKSAGTITVCRKRLRLSCINGTYTALSAHEVTEFPNMSVLWKVGGKVYAEGKYYKRNSTIWICTNFSSKGTKETFVEKVEQSVVIITNVGLSLSVVFLSALLITYSIFCELRTLPGINLMNLSFSVLVSHLLWLLGSGLTSETKSCTVISVALHFAFLSSFVWMSIIAIDTWRAFTKSGQRTNRMIKRDKRKRYLRSMAIGWLSPLIFCLFCFTLDKTNTVAIGYGGTKGCWIQNTSSNLSFFAAPIGVLLLVNAVFFVLTVKSIRETMKNSKMATGQKRGKKDLGIFVRIAALMGFTWVFGFLSSLNLYLVYVFVNSCTLQGVYISVAFLFTKRILKLYSVQLSKGRSSPSTKVSSSSHQKGQTEQRLSSYSSFNSTKTEKNISGDRTELHLLEIVTNNVRESNNRQDTHL